jgi:hypothetical protein
MTLGAGTGRFGASRQNQGKKKGRFCMFYRKKKHIQGNHPIILNFIETHNHLNGYGYFEGDQEAVNYASDIGMNQDRKYRRHDIVPKALIRMLAKHFTFQGKENPIYRDIKYSEFLTILMTGPYKNEAGRQVCEKFYRDLLVKEMPWLGRSFAMNDNFYNGMRSRDYPKKDEGKMRKEAATMID